MTHTPGPYSYRPHSYDDWGAVRDSNGLLVCLARGGRNLTQKEIDEYRSNGTDPYEDNGRLFAAAPDMLAAMLSFERATQLNNVCNDDPSASLEWMDASDDAVSRCAAVLKRLRDAGVIAKAEESA